MALAVDGFCQYLCRATSVCTVVQGLSIGLPGSRPKPVDRFSGNKFASRKDVRRITSYGHHSTSRGDRCGQRRFPPPRDRSWVRPLAVSARTVTSPTPPWLNCAAVSASERQASVPSATPAESRAAATGRGLSLTSKRSGLPSRTADPPTNAGRGVARPLIQEHFHAWNRLRPHGIRQELGELSSLPSGFIGSLVETVYEDNRRAARGRRPEPGGPDRRSAASRPSTGLTRSGIPRCAPDPSPTTQLVLRSRTQGRTSPAGRGSLGARR